MNTRTQQEAAKPEPSADDTLALLREARSYILGESVPYINTARSRKRKAVLARIDTALAKQDPRDDD